MKEIYTGYAWRPMTPEEIEIMDATKVRPFKRKNPKAGEIYDPTVNFYGKGFEWKNKGIQQLAPFIFENMNFTERAEITAVMRRAMIRIAEEYVNGAKENAEKMNRDNNDSSRLTLTPEQLKKLGIVPTGETAGCRTETKIIVGGRGTGKTTTAIIESANTGFPILAFNRRMADYIVSQADDIGIKIPTPLTLQQVRNGRLCGHKREDRLIVDEGLMILERMLGMSIHMITMSEREEYKDMFTHEYLAKWVPGGGEADDGTR